LIDGNRVLAIVPARAGSKGLPGKNVRLLHGKPLLAWPILAARGSAYVDDVIVSTDSRAYADIAAEHGAAVPFLRPAELASDTAPSIGFIDHALDTLAAAGKAFDYVVLLEPTSPLTEAADIDAALEMLHAARDRAQAIVGVAPMEATHPAFCVRRDTGGLIAPYGGSSFDTLPRRQDLDPVFALDGTLYISTVAGLRAHSGFCHAGTLGYVTDRVKGLEVDDLVDFICIEALMAHRDAARAAAAAVPNPQENTVA
jgi:CMP-N,N'-diacetyllegionaminic acid synthase